MNELSNEILNKYIDNELSISEVNELKEYIKQNPDELKKFSAHTMLDNILHEMPYEKAPDDFTNKLMTKIIPASLYKKHHSNYLVNIVLSIFGLLIVGFVVAALFSPKKQTNESSAVSKFFDEAILWASTNLPSITSISSNGILVLLSAVVLIGFISLYVLINSHKHFKRDLENFSS